MSHNQLRKGKEKEKDKATSIKKGQAGLRTSLENKTYQIKEQPARDLDTI